MSERAQIYDELCRVLTDFDEAEGPHSELENSLYEVLVKIQMNWEAVITAENS